MKVTLDSLKKNIGKKMANSQAFAWFADFERLDGNLDIALQRIDGGLTMYPQDVAARLVRSMIMFEQENFEACIEDCEKALKIDPFCLSAQKRMGDAYDKLGMQNERNLCYRRVHDMDPLDTSFWKDEYEQANEDVAAMAAIAESDLAMPDLETNEESLDLNLQTDASEEEQSFLVKSPEDGEEVEEDQGPKFGSGFEFVNEEQDSIEESVGPTPADEVSDKDPIASFGVPSSSDDNPFAALANIGTSADDGEEAAMDNLQSSLDSAMAAISEEQQSAPEVFPADDDISGSDVNSAMSSFFGVDDDLEPEEPAAPASPFSNLNLSAKIDEEPEAVSNASKIFSEPAQAEKPQSVDNAFDSIFGEDELPEEKPVASAAQAEKPQSVDNAFDSIFGEDELPEEKPVASAAQAEKPQSVDNAFDSIFGEDELPEEKTAAEPKEETLEEPAEESFGFEKSASSTFEKSADESLETTESLESEENLSADFGGNETAIEESTSEVSESVIKTEAPASATDEVEKEMSGAFDSLFGSDDDLVEEPKSEKAEPNAEAEKSVSAADEVEKEMSGAFDSLFGSDDDLPEESAQENTGAAIEEKIEASSTQTNDFDNLESEISGAFKGLFDTEDDLPEESTPTNKGVDFLMSGDSDDEVSVGLIKDPTAPLDNAADLDESLNTRTLAEIYLEQGLYGKALEIYQDLAKKEPENEEIQDRIKVVQQMYNEKFGGSQNG